MEKKVFNNQTILSIEDLKFKYNNKSLTLVIKKLNLQENKIITLLGPSGSGKTTLLNLIAGFIKSKNIKIKNNLSINEIGYIMQNFSLYENVSAKENIYVSAKNSFSWKYQNKINFWFNFLENNKNIKNKNKITLHLDKMQNFIKLKKYSKIKWTLLKIEAKLFFNINFLKQLKKYKLKSFFEKDLKDIAKQLGIENILNKKANELSGGEKQRVAFAKSIIKKNKLILMDEPFSALDAKIKEQTIDWLKKIQKIYNLSIIIVTHDQIDAMQISDLILVLKNGEIQQLGTSQELYDDPKNLFVAKFIGFPEIHKIGENKDFWFFVRDNKMFLTKNKNGKWKVKDKKIIGDFCIFNLETLDNNKFAKSKWNCKDFEIDDKLNLYFHKNDLIIFDKKTEQRVYNEKNK
ncbi:ATP-binding cassette domain-containing protein [Mesomycoplasma neurolyticum]|uniref:Multiple sugar ABC transporter ATP-binding protein n=1 Tax=Mesomycoplasma neurolyticum TaxID=2120 RepID=A0A449A5E5_9BACT|nr:ABC transporter ATP-binding protein [Mesomycoplasma neurolyticum]VEU59510.1 multiple sugar ABC transporter ATP-binding protein [Mesomycoplasma neurolyticum]